MAEIAASYSPREAAACYHASQNRRQERPPLLKPSPTWGATRRPSPRMTAAQPASNPWRHWSPTAKLRRAYLKDRMHAKACIGCTGIPSAPGTAIIGSAGFAGNTEPNYPVIHGGDVAEIRGRFERLWQEGEPVSDRMVEQLRAGWPLAVPDLYLMCLKSSAISMATLWAMTPARRRRWN